MWLVISFCVCILQTIVCNANPVTPFSPRVTLETSKGLRGSLTSVAKNYPDLSTVGFDNKAHVACVIGTWVFYGSKNYANFSDGVSVQFSKSNKCYRFQNLDEKVSSMRYAGSGIDFRQDYIDLYSGRFFTGTHLRSNGDLKNVPATGLNSTSSIIVSGTSGWTLYDQPSFAGTSKCVTPQGDGIPRFFRNAIELGGMTVKSFRRGC